MPANTFHIEKLPTIQRLPAYLHILKGMAAEGVAFVSATTLGAQMELQPIVARKDMAVTGIVGRPKVGYPVKELIRFIESFLGWDRLNDALLVGVGHLGTALLGYEGFVHYGLRILAAFDIDPAKVGTSLHDRPVFHLSKLDNLVQRLHIRLGILSVPAAHAQEVADRMVEAGIQGIWNFSSVQLFLPPRVICQNQDLASGLAVLSSQIKKADEAQ